MHFNADQDLGLSVLWSRSILTLLQLHGQNLGLDN